MRSKTACNLASGRVRSIAISVSVCLPVWLFDSPPAYRNKKLSYRKWTARRAMSVEILLSAVALLYEESHLKRLAKGE